ncbi:bifunctional adenosylcobinamide kinase/adenosylcobinamide-phosphate guanylyltransferase [Actinoplanes sp. RD1]|uniref:bifunctional adenosylcobinamide kinase/adenosylcobinamide-phosphate guanylyltransferase n=1 Tax=Actinoplanes sp. RD1 TaxID=3064538 RepID=UPI002741AFD1|nr:bifunctional adenosylcobinamide kinase/adenosylcobinamide-phosphate guanylyltransferase [Actinoplanes sp. RD1]
MSWNSVLVLGGIRSGKSAFAEALVADAPAVRYVATAAGGQDDPEWLARIEAHQRRRPQAWSTEETGADPARLTALLTEAKPDDTLLIDDLGGWVAALLDPAHQPNDDVATVTALAEAVRSCAGRVVLVSPEVGLSLVPQTPLGRAFADAVGTANQALADACDRVVLVVAGRPAWLKTSPDEPGIVTDVQADESVTVEPPAAVRVAAAATPLTGTATAERPDIVAVTAGAGDVSEIEPGMDLPLPDSDAGPDARDRLVTLDLPGAGLGALIEAVEFAAATQGTATPRPWGPARVLLLAGHHAGGAASGSDPAEGERRAGQAEAGAGALARLAGSAGADLAVVRVPESGAMEDGPVLTAEAVDAALRQGWSLAAQAAEDGREALVIAACGTGTDAAAAAVLAATTGAEPVAVLPRVLVPGGFYDDEAWMRRCAAVRDAMHRIRQEPRGAKDLLAQLGGADLAVAAGVLLGAAAARLPVLVDGPVGIAAGLIARDLGPQSRHWCLLADAGKLALVRQGADVLGLTPVLELGLDLGEGANALAALPLLRTAIALAGALPVHPALLEEPGDGGLDDDAAFVEPEPDGPGPASV